MVIIHEQEKQGNFLAKTLKKIQSDVDEWVHLNNGYWSDFEQLAALLEECGELAKELHHLHGPKKKKKDDFGSSLEEEMGDVLFVLAGLANSNQIDLEKAFDRAIRKYNSRDKNRWRESK